MLLQRWRRERQRWCMKGLVRRREGGDRGGKSWWKRRVEQVRWQCDKEAETRKGRDGKGSNKVWEIKYYQPCRIDQVVLETSELSLAQCFWDWQFLFLWSASSESPWCCKVPQTRSIQNKDCESLTQVCHRGRWVNINKARCQVREVRTGSYLSAKRKKNVSVENSLHKINIIRLNYEIF